MVVVVVKSVVLGWVRRAGGVLKRARLPHALSVAWPEPLALSCDLDPNRSPRTPSSCSS